MRRLLQFTSLIILASCSFFQNEDTSRYIKSNTVENQLEKNIKTPWISVKSEGSDYALNNTHSNSFFLFNSSCRKFDSSNLNTLTTSMLTGIDDLKISNREKIVFQDRDAVLLEANGKLDGVIRYFKILTTQKNNCIYDFVLIATSKKHLEKDSLDFSKFIELIKLY